jgi:hypothetical protein
MNIFGLSIYSPVPISLVEPPKAPEIMPLGPASRDLVAPRVVCGGVSGPGGVKPSIAYCLEVCRELRDAQGSRATGEGLGAELES